MYSQWDFWEVTFALRVYFSRVLCEVCEILGCHKVANVQTKGQKRRRQFNDDDKFEQILLPFKFNKSANMKIRKEI